MGQSKSKQNTASLTNAAASSSSSSLPLSPTDHQKHYTYEVFLSFRGEDTRCNFTDHLYTALRDRGIETFRDADKLRRGEEISPALLKAIEESRVSIVVFSPNYASSRWCLDELVKILECRKPGQEVIPVFYKVDPSHVRHQTDAFGDAFATLVIQPKYKDSIGKWRGALSYAANLSGWTYVEGRSEAEFIKMIVGDLSARVVNHSYDLVVAEHPIGLKSCRQDVSRLLYAEKNNMVGIWGPGGIGKTTIAKDVFNSIRHEFDYRCFLSDVRSTSLAQLQGRLLSHILGDIVLEVSSVDQGVSLIRTRMRNKKILLILDDVSHDSQLKNLVPSPDCFSPDSRILITTRDKRCLTAHQVNEVYEVKILDDDQALQLFSLNAFKSNGPPHAYLELARRVVRYAQGLPLALIVLGSHLFNRSIEEWEATISSCKGGPQADIQQVLKLSYDALEKNVQELFLDIACFFNGEDVADVKPILEACHDHKTMVTGIAQLQEKALIRIDKDDCIWMHDLIEEMGQDMVYQESPEEPEKRSRVWSEEDVNDVLTCNTGIKEVKGIQVLWQSSPISLNARSFSGMEKLRYISMRSELNYELISGDVDYLSKQLRWLDWPACPLQCFPSNFYANKLVHLNISHSCSITRLWKGRKNFPRLRCMNLSGCTSLKELPDFSGIPILKELDLSWCTSLVEVPDSIQFLHKLVTFKVDHCSNLIKFPRKINLKSVETISISYWKLEEFSEVGEETVSLRSLNLSGTCIEELHPSITRLIRLEELGLADSQNLTTLPYNIYELHNLKTLDARGCLKLATFPKIPVKMDSLRRLSLEGSGIRELDWSIENLIGLEDLDLSDCKNLTTLPCSIYGLQNLKIFWLSNCSKLVRFPTNTKNLNVDGCSLSLPKLQKFSVRGCSLLSDCDFLMALDCWETLEWLDLSRNNFVSLPAFLTKFVKLQMLDLKGCWRLRGIPELPPSVVDLRMDLLRRLYLKDSDIRELDESIENLNGLEELDLSGCKNLTTLSCIIYGLHNLKTLDVSGCSKLATFPKSPVKMDFLGRLYLKGSDIRELDESIENLIGLEELDLSGCKNLTTLPCNIYGLHNLKTLDASGCSKLASFPKIPVKMDSLRRLSLQGSDIRELDESIENLNGLEELDLSGCKNLTTLPCIIYGLHNLKTLDASGCSKLASFPKILVKMDSLRRLSLKGSDIRELDESIENLNGLEELDLSGCKNLTTLTCSIYGLHNLKTLDASGCSKLATFPKISVKMDSLRRLSLQGSGIRELDESIENLNGLEELDLSGCKNLTTLPCSIYGLHNLKTLDASGCSKLATFPKIPVKMNSLRLLSLKGSDIRELDESIENLIGLEGLDLRYCKNLSTLPCSIYGLHNLKTLDASGCSKLAIFPKITVKMDSLRLLSLKGSDIRELDESIGNLIGLEYLDLTDCENLTTLPCSIYGLQNLWFVDLGECSKLVRFPTNTKILNVDGCSLSLPKLGVFSIAGCSSLSDCDFLMTLDCWETLQWLNLSRNNFVSLPACLTKFVKLRSFDLEGCKRLRGIPELPPNVKPDTSGCESLEERFSTLTNRGAVIEAASPSIEEPTPSSGLSLYSEAPKRHRTAAGAQASMVHSAHEMAISPIPMIPDLQTHHFGWHSWRSYILSANDDYRHQQKEQKPVPISQLVRNFNTIRNQLSC